MNDSMMHAALHSVAEACKAARHVQRDLDRVQRIIKDDKSPVTVADFAVQAIIATELAERLGSVHIVGEEHSAELRQQQPVLDAVLDAVRIVRPSMNADDVLAAIDACNHDASAETFWTLDPVDGTKGFLRGQQYAIALARIANGEVTHGAMGCPNLPVDDAQPLEQADPRGCMYAAMRGLGSWQYAGCDPKSSASRVRGTAHRPGDTIRACESVEASHSKQDDTARILQKLGSAGRPARLDSQCKYAVVARNQADAYLRLPTKKGYVEKIWDHAAGMIIAQEAGVIVSDITGAPLDFACGSRLERNRGIICAASGLHPRIIEAIQQLGLGAAV